MGKSKKKSTKLKPSIKIQDLEPEKDPKGGSLLSSIGKALGSVVKGITK
jgi:hypothetical protein